MTVFRNPAPTVDAVILVPDDRVVLVRRKNPPLGWAIPGGFVDEGEPLEAAATAMSATVRASDPSGSNRPMHPRSSPPRWRVTKAPRRSPSPPVSGTTGGAPRPSLARMASRAIPTSAPRSAGVRGAVTGASVPR